MNRTRVAIFVFLACALAFGAAIFHQLLASRGLPREAFTEKRLRVLTYASFMAGPGKTLVQGFQTMQRCKVDVVTVQEAGLLLERMKLGPAFDVVIGLDQLTLPEGGEGWRAFEVEPQGWFEAPLRELREHFIPYDWSPLTFIYKGEARKPMDFNDLLKPEFKGAFALQDPHVSTPGLQFFNWVRALTGSNTASWLEQFKPNVNSVSPSWAFSYGLLQKQQTRFVFTYLTSLAYHWGDEADRGFQVLQIKEGHPIQVEFAGIPESCKECELAEAFVAQLLEPEVQKLIMSKNFMLPVIQGPEANTVYAELPQLKPLSLKATKDLREWDQIFR